MYIYTPTRHFGETSGLICVAFKLNDLLSTYISFYSEGEAKSTLAKLRTEEALSRSGEYLTDTAQQRNTAVK